MKCPLAEMNMPRHRLVVHNSPVLVDEGVECQSVLPACAEVLHIYTGIAVRYDTHYIVIRRSVAK